jgi:hypothetical protein
MKILLWLILFVLCWPLALAVLVLYPIIWLILLPFKILGFTVSAVFDMLGLIIKLPFKILGKIF